MSQREPKFEDGTYRVRPVDGIRAPGEEFYEALSPTAEPERVEPDREDSRAEKPKSTPHKDSKAPQWGALISGLLIALIMATIMVTTYVSAQHAPAAHNLPWGVTGPSSLTDTVQNNVSLQIHNYASQTDLISAMNNTTVYGGFIPQTHTLMFSEAASLLTPSTMSSQYAKAAMAHKQPLHIQVINKLPSEDPEGLVPGLLTFVLLVAGYLAATMAMQRTHTAVAHWRVGVLAIYSVIASLVIDVIVGPILNAIPNVSGNFLTLWGCFTLLSLSVALLAATIQSLIGPLGTLVTVLIVVVFGNPTTGGSNGTAYLPPFWQAIGPYLPPLNGMLLIRNSLYFGGNATSSPILTLSIYAIVGATLVTLLSWGRPWRSHHKNLRISRSEAVGVSAIPPG